MTAYTAHKIASTTQTQYFTEPLEGLGNALALDMVLVPAGCFMMGSPDDEPERRESEGPQHEVTLPNFFMGRYPVTQAQWRAVAAIDKVDIKLEPDPPSFKGANLPVEQVSWYEAVEFCERLKKHTKRPYHLPSEAEWEYACRAGTTTPFAFGKTLTTEATSYNGNHTYNDGHKGAYREKTTPVDEFGCANAFGLCDMHGNVDEWCVDHWHDNYEGAPIDGSAWLSADETSGRLVRGGSWGNNPGLCRSASRFDGGPDDRDFGIGFRVCCPVPMTLQPPAG
ncbi:MAG: hypothetical protein DCF15_20320 [Phormidesmis priestleyi]|uniref:Sulfatase-modifying factor enzyme-like domain-containing protein n=1 Tax=Phormidesmis priestleyi TaxID=268141 RepID=A0A2W4YIK7_9CYAN|nr:MAG: hypothetical protein DCF15_20320 [Phormidesmis priestleyi]